MRIALYTETFLPQINGIVKVLCLTLEHLQRAGIDAVVVAPKESIDTYAGARVIKVPSLRNPVYPKGRVGLPNARTYNQIRAFAPDVMHMFHPSFSALAGQRFARRLGVPTVASFHLDLMHALNYYGSAAISKFIRKLMAWEFNRSSFTLAPSTRVQQQMHEIGIRNVGLWRRGVDASKFHPRYYDPNMRDLLSGGHPEDHLLLYVGRLAPEKQVHQIKAVLDQVPNTRLAIVGTGAQEHELKQRFAGTPTTFVGSLSGELLSRAFASSDAFVFPSAFESFGLVILEAMASGTPVVSSRVGGAPSVITAGRSGYLFDVNDTQGMVEGVRRTVVQREVLAQMRLYARADAEMHSWSSIMDELIACYRDIAGGKRWLA